MLKVRQDLFNGDTEFWITQSTDLKSIEIWARHSKYDKDIMIASINDNGMHIHDNIPEEMIGKIGFKTVYNSYNKRHNIYTSFSCTT